MPRREGTLPHSSADIKALVDSAKTSRDAIFVEMTIRAVNMRSAPIETRSAALEGIARAHWNTTNVVVASLTSLALLDPAGTRRIAHAILAERFHTERDIIIARAATVLIELSPPDATDIPFISRAVESRIDLIHANTARALRNLPPSRGLALLATARTVGSDVPTTRLRQILEDSLSNATLRLPPRPSEVLPQISRDEQPPESHQQARRPKPQAPRRTTAPISGPTRAQSPEKRAQPKTERREEPPQPAAAKNPSIPAILLEHRSPEAAQLSLRELKAVANTSKDHARILSSLIEIAVRHGQREALDCMDGFVWATSDPENPLKVQFAHLSDALFPR
jgi:hypothetical protein